MITKICSTIYILFCMFIVSAYGHDTSSEIFSLDNEKKFTDAFELISKSNIDETDDEILLLFANYLREGRKGIEVNKAQAKKMLLRLEQRLQGRQDAKSLYYRGLVAKYGSFNPQKAYEYIKEAADAGYSDAQTEIAIMLLKGIGTKADPILAMSYLNKAVAKNNLTAKAYLASYYLGKKKDTEKGIRLAQESSDAGNRAGQYTMGMAYEKGIGVIKDDKKALRLYQLSADQGLDDARDRLLGLKNKLNIPKDQYIDDEK